MELKISKAKLIEAESELEHIRIRSDKQKSSILESRQSSPRYNLCYLLALFISLT
jgi:hypothetical protein